MRAQLPRELYAGGGITQVRQPYFIGKLVRKVTKPFKKIVKSPVGKAAALYGLGTMLGGMPAFGGTGQLSFFDRLKNPALLKNLITPSGWSEGNVLNTLLRKNIAEEGAKKAVWGSFSPFKLAAAAATAAPFVAPGMDETTEVAEDITNRKGKFDFDFAEMRSDIAQAVRGGDYDTFKAVLDKYDLVEGVDVNKWGDLKTGTLAKDGGRIGYAFGDRVNKDQIKEDLKTAWDWSLPGAMSEGIGSIKDRIMESDIETKDIMRMNPLTRMIVAIMDRYGVSKEEAERIARNQMADANLPPMDTTSDEGFREDIGIESSAEDYYPGSKGTENFDPSKFDRDKLRDIMRDYWKDKVKIKQFPEVEIDSPRFKRREKNPMYLKQDTGLRFPIERFLEEKDTGLRFPIERFLEEKDTGVRLLNQGGRIGMQEGGIMDLGGIEKDYRNTGGFVEIGGKERADDVPARLSKNEFVFTADAVRSAGGGDIDKGAEIMENVMKNLEAGGKISEESQGMRGAQEMFDVSERLSEVI